MPYPRKRFLSPTGVWVSLGILVVTLGLLIWQMARHAN